MGGWITKMVRKGTKIERLEGKMSEREAIFDLRQSVYMLNYVSFQSTTSMLLAVRHHQFT